MSADASAGAFLGGEVAGAGLVRGRSAFDPTEMPFMRKRIRWLLLVAALVLAPSSALAQMEVAPVSFTGPLSHPRYDDGGPYIGLALPYLKTNRPFDNQVIAYRGFFDLDGALGTQFAWVGSKDVALQTSQLFGPGTWQPGWDITAGYRFHNGTVVELQWRHLVQARYTAQAALIPPGFNVGTNFENTFVSSLVSGFGTEWAGNEFNTADPNATAATTFGIWNAASFMQIEWVQRFDVYGINVRVPMAETASYRSYGLFGPRIVWIWDRFKWRTVDQDENGEATPDTVAIYTNQISNRLNGVHFGSGHDWYFGDTPIGGFAATIEVEGGLYLDMCKTRVAWDREDLQTGIRRARRFYPLSPAAEIRAGLWWYPWEAVSIQVSYEFQAYFNTISSRQPIDFNLSTVNPEFNAQFIRFFQGIRFGISFVF